MRKLHRSRLTTLLPLLCVAPLALIACEKKEAEPKPTAVASAAVKKPAPSASTLVTDDQLAAYKPKLPEVMAAKHNPITEEKVKLGRMLYYDKRLSKNHDISCNSCHDLEKYGVDNEPMSPGHKKQRGDRNSPSTYNAAAHFVQFWDGRSPHVEHQATQPVTNPVEMAMPSPEHVKKTLESMPGYVKAFKKAFPDAKDPVTIKNAGIAIGAFERKLTTPSRWDKFLAGDEDALTPEEKKGFATFVNTGCNACHNGTYLGGVMYQKVGVVKPWPNQEDQGRFEATKVAGDRMMFKVPGLRNVAKTAPYFHDASAKTLEEAVKKMAEHQLGKRLSEQEVASIVTWLESLTGEIPTDYIKKPELPESTASTPKADPS